MATPQGAHALGARLRAILVAILAGIFFLFFDVTKHTPSLAAVNPFAEDPYDAVGSYAVLASGFLAALALVRVSWPVRPARDRAPRAILLARTKLAIVLMVVVTVAADGVALARHTAAWQGTTAGIVLCALLSGLILIALATGMVIRPAGLVTRASRGHIVWAALVLAGSLVVLAVYPEALRDSIPGELFTVVTGAVLLFASVRAALMALVPAQPEEASSAGRSHGWVVGLRWVLVLGAGLTLGLAIFLAEARQEGMA
ncbi:MAG TPA: hypothetical protein VF807_10105, partial [Ktedonobacterales bacterium]